MSLEFIFSDVITFCFILFITNVFTISAYIGTVVRLFVFNEKDEPKCGAILALFQDYLTSNKILFIGGNKFGNMWLEHCVLLLLILMMCGLNRNRNIEITMR